MKYVPTVSLKTNFMSRIQWITQWGEVSNNMFIFGCRDGGACWQERYNTHTHKNIHTHTESVKPIITVMISSIIGEMNTTFSTELSTRGSLYLSISSSEQQQPWLGQSPQWQILNLSPAQEQC